MVFVINFGNPFKCVQYLIVYQFSVSYLIDPELSFKYLKLIQLDYFSDFIESANIIYRY